MAQKTLDELTNAITAARMRERSARVAAARLTREMSSVARRQDAQRLCVLGRAWSAFADEHPSSVEDMQRFLEHYVSRETDRAVLATDSRWALAERQPVAVPEPEPDGPEAESDGTYAYDETY